jgi:hypothetical protein
MQHPQKVVRDSCLECIQSLQAQVSKLSTDAVVMMRIFEQYKSTLEPMLGKPDKALARIQKSVQNGDVYGPPSLNSWPDDTVRVWLAARLVSDALEDASIAGKM